MKTKRHTFNLLLPLFFFASSAFAQEKKEEPKLDAAWLAEHYTKYEYRLLLVVAVALL